MHAVVEPLPRHQVRRSAPCARRVRAAMRGDATPRDTRRVELVARSSARSRVRSMSRLGGVVE